MDCRKGEYAERRARGVCVICGRRQPTVLPNGTKMASCDECGERQNRYKRNMRARKAGKVAEHTDPVVGLEKSIRCKNCKILINDSYYYCPWCGHQQQNIPEKKLKI